MLKHLARFFFILAERKVHFFLILFFSFITSILEAVGISLVGPFIALATDPNLVNQNNLLNWIFLHSGIKSINIFIALIGGTLIFIFYLKSFVYFYIQRYIFSFSFRLMTRLQANLINAYLFIPYVFHLNKNSAVLIQNIAIESGRFCMGFMIPLLNSCTKLIVSIVLIFLLIKTNYIATICISLILLTSIFIYISYSSKISSWGEEASNTQTEIIRIVKHALGGLKETRVLGCEEYFEKKMTAQAMRHAKSRTLFNAFKFLPKISIEALLITFLVGFTSILLFTNDAKNLTSELGIFALASMRLIPTMSQLIASLSTIRNNFFPLDKIYYDLKELEKYQLDTISKEGYEKHADGSNSILHSQGTMPFEKEIEIKGLVYCYPNASEPSINNISLSINKGQSIALIGKSGAGKTTLVDIILGLLVPDSGEIRVDGTSIYNDIRSWQNLIGYIPQTIFLMDDTIERNIAYGVPDESIDHERMINAIHSAQLSDLIGQSEDGLKTVIGEQGVRLSGGQRQRLGIARALYYGREILVLDEATASLDTETEYLVSKAIQSLSNSKTLIIIAHRLSTVENCDYIYMLDKGRLLKSGSYSEVVLSK